MYNQPLSIALATCLALAAAVVACGPTDDGDSDGSSSSSSGSANGVTPCGAFDGSPKSCPAGQYCADETLSICENGCLSNTNCADDQLCQKDPGYDVGTCQNTGSAVSCADLCAKLQACDPAITQAQCDQACAGLNDTCKSCIVGANCTELNDGTACYAECGVSE